jgi:hypothetical protein
MMGFKRKRVNENEKNERTNSEIEKRREFLSKYFSSSSFFAL